MSNLAGREEKFDKTLSFQLDNVLNWRLDEVRRQEFQDSSTMLEWIIDFRHIGEGEEKKLEFRLQFEGSVDEIDEIELQHAVTLIDRKNPTMSDSISTETLPYTEVCTVTWPFEMIVDPTNHYLWDGSVIVTFDFCILSILYKDGISRFHFRGKPFDWKRKHLLGLKKKEENDVHFYIDREIAAFHSPYFATFDKGFTIIHIFPRFECALVEKCLQIMYGVQLQIEPEEIGDMLEIAGRYCMMNVVHYIETYSLQICLNGFHLGYATIHCLQLKRLTKARIRLKYKTIPEMKMGLETMLLDENGCLSGEVMKTWMEFFMNLA